MAQTKPLWIRNAKQIATFKNGSGKPLTKEEMGQINLIENGSIWIEDGIIKMIDKDEAVRRHYQNRLEEAAVILAEDKVVTPGLVDPHTHLVFGGSRETEFEQRLHGATYMEIMGMGGGIHSTTRATQSTSEEELAKQAVKRLDQFLLHGVTTVEAKSGYGLTLEHELKQLRVAKWLQENHHVDVVSTFMGAHAVPLEYKQDPDEFVRIICEEMIPAVADCGLAEFNDVFCEKGVFTPEQCEKILAAGKKHGLIAKIHADEIEPYKGAELAAKMEAISADHLLRASDEGLRQMAEAGVIAVLLPATAFFLMTEPARARKMIDMGIPVALSTDCNPGSSPTESLPFVMNLGCLMMKMTPAEALAAATINAAHAIHRGRQMGSLETGKKADIVIWNAPNYVSLQYHFGVNLADTVVKDGVVAVENGQIKTHIKSF